MPFLPRLTNRQWATFIVIAFSKFATAVCISIQAPFYPAEAERKGAYASQYGFVFGCYQLVILFFSPIFGKYSPVLMPNFMLISGLFVTGSCSILFGVLDQINDVDLFIGFSFAVRIFEALGSALFLTAAFAIVADTFQESASTAFASLETFFGIGLIAGPAVGGVLFQLGGYILPFAVVGGILLSTSFLSWMLLPNSFEGQNNELEGGGILKILRIPAILLAWFSVFTTATAIGFLDATLEPHLRPFELEPAILGLIFVIEGLSCAISGPVWGYLCDRVIRPKTGILIGSILLTGGFLLIGPVPFIPLKTTLTLVIVGLVIAGFGIEALIVAGFGEALQAAALHGFPNNLSTYGLVSGIYGSALALGAFVGPSVAGVLMDYVGFPYSTYLVIGTSCLLAIFATPFLFLRPERPFSPDGLLAVTPKKRTNYGSIGNSRDDLLDDPLQTLVP